MIQIIALISIMYVMRITHVDAIYCADIKSVGCIEYCNNLKCSFGYCPLDYGETFSDCRCLSCDRHESNRHHYGYINTYTAHTQIEYPTYDVSLNYLDQKIEQATKRHEKYPEQYKCDNVECYKKIKEGLIKSHDNNFY